ncbi:MAG TPA: alpha/beta hydrolase [Caulobacteraceae bacterium]
MIGVADMHLRGLAARTFLSLPTPVLRALAGGGVVYQGGRTLDPRFQYLASRARGAPALTSLAPIDARVASARLLSHLAHRTARGVRIEAVSIPRGAGTIPARAYRGADQNPGFPVVVFAHFGGGVIGDLDAADAFCSILAEVAGCPVLSIDYRLAPEHRFPAGLDDMFVAYRWARDNAGQFGAPTGRAAVGGDSMGANFAAVVAQETKRLNERQPALQLLIYPALDVASESASMTTYADAYPLSRAIMEWFMGYYMRPGDAPTDPRLSPLRAVDLSGLAPAVIATAGFDPLSDQGEAYVRRLREAGVPVAFRAYDHLAHAFTAFTGVVPSADRACREIAGLVREGFARGPA